MTASEKLEKAGYEVIELEPAREPQRIPKNPEAFKPVDPDDPEKGLDDSDVEWDETPGTPYSLLQVSGHGMSVVMMDSEAEKIAELTHPDFIHERKLRIKHPEAALALDRLRAEGHDVSSRLGVKELLKRSPTPPSSPTPEQEVALRLHEKLAAVDPSDSQAVHSALVDGLKSIIDK